MDPAIEFLGFTAFKTNHYLIYDYCLGELLLFKMSLLIKFSLVVDNFIMEIVGETGVFVLKSTNMYDVILLCTWLLL